jgi:cyclase
MLRTRVIPVLLLKGTGLVKTVKFKNEKYIGDPRNAVKIFNDKEVDELIFLDIEASKKKRKPNFKLIEEITSECFVPLGYGGGITSIEEIRKLFTIGIEKVILNSSFLSNPNLVREASSLFGSQSIVVSIDVKKNIFKRNIVYNAANKKNTKYLPLEIALKAQEYGAGEVFLNIVDRDGTFLGYDIDLCKKISERLTIPTIICGGAQSLNDFKDAVVEGRASAVAAGSFFVYHQKHKAVLINYPEYQELEKLFKG